MPHLGVLGPRSRDVVQELTETDISGLGYFRFIPQPVQVGGVPVYLSRTGFGGELGYELFLTDPANAEDLWDVVVNKAEITPFGADAIEILRIEAGLIVTDYDYEAHERSPFDFNFDPFVKLDAPGEPLGRDRLEDLAKAPPNRLVTLRYEAEALPEYGAVVTKEGEEVGVLTSPTDSPRYGKIGIAVLRSDQANLGNAVEVAVGESTVPATVDVLPLYDPQKTRPRS
jgi:aminomethyltransferase